MSRHVLPILCRGRILSRGKWPNVSARLKSPLLTGLILTHKFAEGSYFPSFFSFTVGVNDRLDKVATMNCRRERAFPGKFAGVKEPGKFAGVKEPGECVNLRPNGNNF